MPQEWPLLLQSFRMSGECRFSLMPRTDGVVVYFMAHEVKQFAGLYFRDAPSTLLLAGVLGTDATASEAPVEFRPLGRGFEDHPEGKGAIVVGRPTAFKNRLIRNLWRCAKPSLEFAFKSRNPTHEPDYRTIQDLRFRAEEFSNRRLPAPEHHAVGFVHFYVSEIRTGVRIPTLIIAGASGFGTFGCMLWLLSWRTAPAALPSDISSLTALVSVKKPHSKSQGELFRLQWTDYTLERLYVVDADGRHHRWRRPEPGDALPAGSTGASELVQRTHVKVRYRLEIQQVEQLMHERVQLFQALTRCEKQLAANSSSTAGRSTQQLEAEQDELTGKLGGLRLLGPNDLKQVWINDVPVDRLDPKWPSRSVLSILLIELARVSTRSRAWVTMAWLRQSRLAPIWDLDGDEKRLDAKIDELRAYLMANGITIASRAGKTRRYRLIGASLEEKGRRVPAPAAGRSTSVEAPNGAQEAREL